MSRCWGLRETRRGSVFDSLPCERLRSGWSQKYEVERSDLRGRERLPLLRGGVGSGVTVVFHEFLYLWVAWSG